MTEERKRTGGPKKRTQPTSEVMHLDRIAELRATQPPTSFNDIGREFGVTAEAVRQFWARWRHLAQISTKP